MYFTKIINNINKKMSFFISIFILISLFVYNFNYELPENKIKILDEMIEDHMKKARLKTVGFIITSKDSTIFQKIYGDTDKVKTTSPFILGSVSKSFTALGLLKLDISLNQTLDKFDLNDYIDEKDAKDITISELLNHTSGLDSFSSKRLYKKGYYSYSNYGFALLGKIIEKISGKTYHDYMKEKIFNPLKMDNSNAIYHSDIIDSYDNFFGFCTKYTSIESEIGDGFYVPAGFISSSIEDMGKYLRYYLDENSQDYKQYISQMIQGKINLQYNLDYGMGMLIEKLNNQTIYHHNGATNSFLSNLYIYPQLEIGIFIITNTHDMFCSTPTGELMNNILNFVTLDTYGSIDESMFFYIHFTYDIIFLVLIGIPLTYLIITIIRKLKIKKYSWFIGIKGKIIFGIDILLLIIIPIFIIISFYAFNASLRRAVESIKDLKFVIFTIFSTSLFIFIIKLAYVFVYNKYLKRFEIDNNKKTESMDLDSPSNIFIRSSSGVEDEK